MNTARFELHRSDIEKMMITFGMALMEGFGLLTLICGILGIKIF